VTAPSSSCSFHWAQIRLGPALFVPNGQIGSFGALSRIRSLVRSRADLFDLAASGPAAAGLASTILFVLGLSFSTSLPKASIVHPIPANCPDTCPAAAVRLRSA
jgi:hypothetical protein